METQKEEAQLEDLCKRYIHDNTNSQEIDECLQLLQSDKGKEIMARVLKQERDSGRLWKHTSASVVIAIALAATIAYFTLYHTYNTQQPPPLVSATLRPDTATTAHYEVLPDGSKIYLEPGSSYHLAAGFGKKNRELNVDGFACFEAAPNAQMPFVVHAGPKDIVVLGTSFYVQAYAQEPVVVAVQAGRVKVTGNHQQPNILTAQQGVSYDIKTGTMQPFTVNEGSEKWHSQGIEFFNVPPDQILNALSNWYGIKVTMSSRVRFAQPQCIAFSFSDTPEQAFQYIADLLKAQYSFDAKAKEVRLE